MMNDEETLKHYKEMVAHRGNYSEALCAVETLMEFVRVNKNSTVSGLLVDVNKAIRIMENTNVDHKALSVKTACTNFMEYITYTDELHQNHNIETCKVILLERANEFLETSRDAVNKIALQGNGIPLEKKKILVHSYSQAVLHFLREMKPRFDTVYVTQSAPNYSGKKMHEELVNAGIDAVSILDSSVGYFMQQVHYVFLGAEVVCQDGGILSKIGTYTIALCAKFLNCSVYVCVESFKFSTLFPMSNRLLTKDLLYRAHRLDPKADTKCEYPELDFTPHELITYYVTDEGVTTPIEQIKKKTDVHI